MAIDIDLYANGNDPFTFSLGDLIVHVHAGAPPGGSSTAPGPAPAPEVAPVTGVSVYPTKTRVGPPINLTYVHGADETRAWLNEVELEPGDQPVRFRLDTVSGAFGPEIHTLLEGLQDFGERSVNVDIVGWSEPGDG
jgi:hypothetical protein